MGDDLTVTAPLAPAPETRPRKIALIGYAPNVRLTPWDDPTVEIWGLNDQAFTMPRVDVLFELHKPDIIKAEGHWDRLKALQIPVFMQEKYPEIPTSVRYPIEMVRERYMVAGQDRPYITCSASLMLPIAVESMPTPQRIDVYGVDMAQDTEFAHQRPSCEFFLGVAHGLGIKLSVQHSSDLLKTRFLYAFEDEELTVFQQQIVERLKYLNDMMGQAAQKESSATAERLQYLGAVQDCEHIRKRYAIR